MASSLMTLSLPSVDIPDPFRLPVEYPAPELLEHVQTGNKLPPGFPVAVGGACAWNASQPPRPDQYTLALTVTEVAELESALISFKELGLDGDCVDSTNFPLPTLAPRVQEFTRELHDGQGFFIVRGLDPNRYSPEDNALLFLGVSSHVADRRGCQDRAGNILTHVTDHASSSVPHCKRRMVETNAPLKFHNDHLCDIIALQSRQTAADGGDILLASSSAVYNDLVTQCPSLLDLASHACWPFHNPQGDPACVMRPLLFHENGRIMFALSPDRIRPPEDYIKRSGQPCLTASQNTILDIIESTAEKHHAKLKLKPGDLLYFNNLGLLHSRKGYRDTPSQARHLVRLWLRNSELGWDIPKSLVPEWRLVFHNDAEKVYQIEAKPVLKTPIYRFPTH